jgi:hypothetical protein
VADSLSEPATIIAGLARTRYPDIFTSRLAPETPVNWLWSTSTEAWLAAQSTGVLGLDPVRGRGFDRTAPGDKVWVLIDAKHRGNFADDRSSRRQLAAVVTILGGRDAAVAVGKLGGAPRRARAMSIERRFDVAANAVMRAVSLGHRKQWGLELGSGPLQLTAADAEALSAAAEKLVRSKPISPI